MTHRTDNTKQITPEQKAEVERLIQNGQFDYARIIAEAATEELTPEEKQVAESATPKFGGQR